MWGKQALASRIKRRKIETANRYKINGKDRNE